MSQLTIETEQMVPLAATECVQEPTATSGLIKPKLMEQSDDQEKIL